jgi:thiamine-phosphate pyrophosphorylase
MIEIYADGAYNPVSGQGGWAAVVVENGGKQVVSGITKPTTNNRMEITAAMEGILKTPDGAQVVVYTDSQYLFGCMSQGWQRKANRDLWEKLDAAAGKRKVRWEWVDQNITSPFHREAHNLATGLSSRREDTPALPAEKPDDSSQPQVESGMGATAPARVLRIMDANLNRTAEGLRLLEDVARLILDDTALTQQLKTMRHEVVEGDWLFHQQLIQARDSESDVGFGIEATGDEKQRDLRITVVANARRVQESLRTLEELAKMPDAAIKWDSDKFKQARFALYTIEKNLLSRLLRQDKSKRISGLYVIIDAQTLKSRNIVEAASQVIRGGAKIIQLRDKTTEKRELFPIAQQLKDLCAEQGVLFIMNDYLDLALAVDADGLHVGQEDLPVDIARKLLPIDKILGASARTVSLATAAQAGGADYIAVGSMYPTTSKGSAVVVGPGRLKQIREAISVPLVAIGGITMDNVSEVMAAGADAVAVIRAALDVENIEETTRQLINRIEGRK